MNRIKIDPARQIGRINKHIFGGFAEHLGRHIYGGIYEPGSPLADERGFRRDVIEAVRRLGMPVIRYPGGNFVSGYRWRDGVGPRSERHARVELAWQDIESNHFGTDEFVAWCRAVDAEPYLVVNAGDGDMREARDWVEYCNSAAPGALANLRRANGLDAPHNVKYWGIGNEVDGHWQIGYKTPAEYARTYTEFAKVMRMVDPDIKLIASVTSDWREQFVERTQLLFEQARDLLDYLAIHWYVGNPEDDFPLYMTVSERIEERITVFEGLIRAMRMQTGARQPIAIAVDEVECLVSRARQHARRARQARRALQPGRRAGGGHALQRLYPPLPLGANGQYRADCQCHRADFHGQSGLVPADDISPI